MPLSLVILLVSILPLILSTARAQSTGLVCVAEGPESCPAIPPTVNSFSAGDADINVVNSSAFNSFDISVKADPTILNASLIHDIGVAFRQAHGLVSIVAECLNGHPIVSNCRSQDGPGVATAAAISNITITGGHLFNITYGRANKAGTTSVAFQTGCTGTSNGNSCVTLSNGSTVDPENIQGETFTTGDFSITASPSSQTVTRGSSTSYTITVRSLNGFTGTISFTSNISPVVSQGPTSSLSQPSVFLPLNGSSATVTLTVLTSASTPADTYTIFATAASCTQCSLIHTASATLVVPAPDFSITASPGSISVRTGSSTTNNVTVTSIGGFSGTVSISSTVTPSNLRSTPTSSLSPPGVSLVSGGTGTSILTVSTTHKTSIGTYTITITGTTGSTTHTTTVTLIVQK